MGEGSSSMNRRSRLSFTDVNPLHFKAEMWAWLFQRISGVVLVVYVFSHIGAISQATFGLIGPSAQPFDPLRNPFWTADTFGLGLDFVVLILLAFHGINGLRVVIFDLGWGVRMHRGLLFLAVAGSVVLTALVILYALPLLGGP